MSEILYGRQPVCEALRAGRRRMSDLLIHATEKASDTLAEIRRLAGQAGVPVASTTLQALDTLTDGGHHQGVAARVSAYPYVPLEDLLKAATDAGEAPLILLLDHIQDPQNLGSLLRTAEAAGVHGVAIPKDRAALVTPAAARASAGAAEHTRVALVTNLVRTMETLKEAGLWIHGLEALDEATPYADADLTGPLGLVVGSEGQGLGRLVREHCDVLLRVPQFGRVGSLNAAIAGAIALFEIRRQRVKGSGKAKR